MGANDAHVHFNMEAADPVEDLLNYISRQRIKNAALLLNTQEEYSLYRGYDWSNWSECRIFPVVGLNRRDPFGLDAEGMNGRIKIHPRLYGMNYADMDWYINAIGKIRPSVIVVDDFLYGASVPKDLGIDLIVLLAQTFPESKVVMAHSGGVQLTEHIMRTRGMENVFYDLSLTINYLALSSVMMDLQWFTKFSWQKIMLGSDYPDFTIRQALQQFGNAVRKNELSKEQCDRITMDNMLTVYGDGYGNA